MVLWSYDLRSYDPTLDLRFLDATNLRSNCRCSPPPSFPPTTQIGVKFTTQQPGPSILGPQIPCIFGCCLIKTSKNLWFWTHLQYSRLKMKQTSGDFGCFLLNAATNSWFWAHLRYSWWGCLAWGRFQPSRSDECIEDGGLQPSRIPILSTWSLWNT